METRDITDWSALDGFKINAASPAVNAGRFVSLDINKHPGTAGTDFFKNSIHDGNVVYNGLPDIGAHEFSDTKFENVTPFIPATVIEPSIPAFEVKLENGTFEDTTKHTNKDPWNFQWNGAITTNNPFEGKYAGEIKAVNGGASIEHIIAVAPNTEYQIDAMTMSGDPSQKLTLGVKWKDNQGKEDKQFVEIKHTEYQPSTITFTTPEGVNAVTLYYYKASGPAIASYIDNVSIKAVVKVDTAELATLIQEVDAMNTSLYTPESMTVLKALTDNAQQLLQSESLTQDIIDNLILEIQKAVNNLVKIDPV
ncbi:carbohydrate binding domain-containing protein, partial [Erysipelothrix anatis]